MQGVTVGVRVAAEFTLAALRMAVQHGDQLAPSYELEGPAQELNRQLTGEVTDLRFPGGAVPAEGDH